MRPNSSAESAIDKAASEWVARRSAGLSITGESEFRDWMAADPRHVEAYSRLARTWAVFDRAEQKGAMNTILTRLELRGHARSSRRIQITAAFGMLTIVGLLLFVKLRSPSMVAPSASTLVKASVEPIQKLPDGSIVELNRGADIAVEYGVAIRRVRLLRGEAHFRVEKDVGRPFVVRAGDVEVQAVGTAFTVQLARQAVEVVVTEGRVALDRANENVGGEPAPAIVKSMLVAAGNRVLVDRTAPRSRTPEVHAMTATEIDSRLAWRVPLLQFSGMGMAEAVNLLNRSNRIQILLDDQSIGRLRVSGVFRSDNPEGFVRIVSATFDLKAENRGDHEVVLRRP